MTTRVELEEAIESLEGAIAQVIADRKAMLPLLAALASLADVEDAEERAMMAERYAAVAIALLRQMRGR